MLRLALGLIFIVVPVLELMLLIKIGQSIGVLATVALVLSTALTGAFIISRQSLSVVRRSLEALSEGRTPVEPVLDGLFLMVAGALLLTPGLATDAVALVLLVPPMRRAIARGLMRWFLRNVRVHVETAEAHGYGRRSRSDQGSDTGRPRPSHGSGDGPVIEGEFERLDDRPVEPTPNGRRGMDA
jgi:UPF0716 protein FxsA